MLGALALTSWLAGCTVLVDADRPQCSKDSDCTARGAAFAGNVCNAAGLCEGNPQWSCVGAQANATPAYKLTMHLQDAVGMKALPGVAAQLCRKLDLTCELPIWQGASDDGGGVAIAIEAGFDGYVQFTHPKISPALYFLTPPPPGEDLDLPTVPLASPAAATLIVTSAGGKGTTWLPDHGIVLLNAFDCQHQTAAGITYSVGGAPDPATFIFYLVKTLPTTQTTVTDSTGYGGLVNMPVGSSTITATLSPGAQKVSTISVLIRAGYISYSSVTPNAM
jgi:hypothetical protein